MLIYNVTLNIEDEVQEQWLTWMKEIHIPAVMDTGMFISHNFAKLLTRQPDETGTTYVIQYFCATQADYDRYQAEFAPALQAETQRLFSGKFVAFRSLMETV